MIQELRTAFINAVLYFWNERDVDQAAISVGYSPQEFKNLLNLYTTKEQRQAWKAVARGMYPA